MARRSWYDLGWADSDPSGYPSTATVPHVGAEKETKHTETSNVRAERVCITDAGNGAPRGVGVKGRWRKKEGLMPAM